MNATDNRYNKNFLAYPLEWCGAKLAATGTRLSKDWGGSVFKVVASKVSDLALVLIFSIGYLISLPFYGLARLWQAGVGPVNVSVTPIAPVVEKHEVASAVKQLTVHFESLKSFSEKESSDLLVKTEALLKEDPISTELQILKKNLLAIQSYFKQLRSIQEMTTGGYVQSGADERGVVQVRGDGNCWLYALLCGMQHLDMPQKTDKVLRKEIVDWMEAHHANDRFLQDLIAIEASDTSGYINSMRQNGSFGGRPELYAFSQIYQVTVHVWREVQGRLTRDFGEDQGLNGGDRGIIQAVMTASGNHFNYMCPQKNLVLITSFAVSL